MPCFVQHAMVPMPFALVRLMADYAETDYGNMFVFGRSNNMTTSDTLYLIRLPDVDDEDCNYGDPARARLDELERKYDINIKSYGTFTTVKNITHANCICHLCKGCEHAADLDMLCEACSVSCKCHECEEFMHECVCDEGDEV